MRSLDEIRTALVGCYCDLERLCAGLSEQEWTVQSLCPEWNVRDVVNHVTGIEAAMVGWLPDDPQSPPPFANATAFLDEPFTDDADYRSKVRAIYDQRRSDLAGLTDADLERPSWMPVGPGTYGRFLEIRVFDLWVHVRDITTPIGRHTDDSGVGAEIALGVVEEALAFIVGKKVGLPDGASVTFQLTGPIVRDLSVVVEGRARRVDGLDHPDVTVATDSTTFLQLACGRIDPQAQIDSGAVTWTGDADLGELAARNLRFTM